MMQPKKIVYSVKQLVRITFVLNIVELINHSHGHGRATYSSDSICFVVQVVF